MSTARTRDRGGPLQGARLVAHYEKLFGDPLFTGFLEHSGYANYGLWDASTTSGKQACDRLIDHLLGHVRGTPRRVVDVACGQGGTTNRLRQRWPAARLVGVNLSPHQLRAAAARVPSAGFVQADAAALPLRDGCADVVLCVEAAFHFDTREAFLREARRVLAPGGVLLMTDVTGRRGAGRVAVHNRLRDAAAYRGLLATVGFAEAAVADVTPQTWRAFRRRYARYAATRGLPQALRMLPRLPWLVWRGWVSDRAIGAYVTVVARRPAAG